MTHNKIAASKLPIAAGIIGNALEWYDFLLYAYFAPILAPLFFPAKDPFVSLLLTFSVFALGFLVRPLGAVIVGRIGDKYGRRQALLITMSLMTVPTVLVGLLPGYAQIGIWAPLMLILIRVAQGLAVSGEIASAATYMIEYAHPNRRGFAGSLVMSSAFLGIMCGAVVALMLTEFMSPSLLHSWGWRLPFLLAAVFGVIGLMIRLRSIESPQFLALKHLQTAPIKTLMKKYPGLLLQGVAITVIAAIGNYFLATYFSNYLVSAGLALKQAMLITVIAMAVFVIMIPFCGFLSDIFGRRKVFFIGVLALMIMAFPCFFWLSQHSFWQVLVAEIIFVIVLAFTSGPVLTAVAELFPTEVRNSGLSLAYNIALALFGGTTPMVALSLVRWTGNNTAPAWFLIIGGIISGIAILWPVKANS